VDVVVIETVRGRDGKRYPVGMPLPQAEKNRIRALAHQLRCGRKLTYSQVQRTLLAEYGIRRSRGELGRDLLQFECPRCAPPPPPPPAPRPRAVPWR
jgi:hypothetical protein